MTSTSLVLSTLIVCASACATNSPKLDPEAATLASVAAMRAAEEVGASKNPQAALHLQYAKEQLAQANWLTGKEAEQRTPGLLMRANADAELAIALARSHVAASKAAAAADQLKQAEPVAR